MVRLNSLKYFVSDNRDKAEQTLKERKEQPPPSIDINKLSRAYRRLNVLYKTSQIWVLPIAWIQNCRKY